MSSDEGRGERLAGLAREEGLDCLLVSDQLNVRYLSGFGGTNGLCLLTAEERLFYTDFRYTERAGQEVSGWALADAERDLLPAAARRMGGRAGYDDADLSVREFRRLEGLVGEGVELVPAGGLVERLRRAKDDGELASISEAAKLADEVYRWTIDRGLVGRSEGEVARDAVARIRELGAEPAFPPIVAAGPNGALPHAEPGDRVIVAGDLVVFDMGARLEGYCSDCTRTFAAGKPDAAARELYELVGSAQQAGLDAVGPGVTGVEADAAARTVIEAAGRGEEFGHGLGHGVGLEVHESPRLSPSSEDTLADRDVVTVEPGVYVAGSAGVRIEDLVVIGQDGNRNLSGMPKELQVVD